MNLSQLYIRDLFWMVLVCACCCGWWLEHHRYQSAKGVFEQLVNLDAALEAKGVFWRDSENGGIEVFGDVLDTGDRPPAPPILNSSP